MLIPDAAPWLADFMDEISSFPVAVHDDQVDAFCQVVNYCREHYQPIFDFVRGQVLGQSAPQNPWEAPLSDDDAEDDQNPLHRAADEVDAEIAAFFGKDISVPRNVPGSPCGICGLPTKGASTSDGFLEHTRYHPKCWARRGQGVIPRGSCPRCRFPVNGPCSIQSEGTYHLDCWNQIIGDRTKAA